MKHLQLHIHYCIYLLLLAFYTPAKAEDEPERTAAAICQEASEYYAQEQYALAMLRYTEGMEAAEKEKDTNTYLICTGCIANIYEAIGDYEADIIYLFKGYEVARNAHNKAMTSIYLSNIVTAYCRMGYAGLAKKYYQLQQEQPYPNDTTEWRYFLIYNKARILQAEGKMEESIDIHLQARLFAEEHGMDSIYALYQTCEIGNIMLKKGDYQGALKYGYEGLSIAQRLKSKELQVNALDILANAYHSTDGDSARKYHNLYLSMSDSVFNARNFYKARNSIAQYETRKSNQHINLLNTIIDKQTLAITVISLLFLLSVTLLILLLLKNKNLRNAQKVLFLKHKELERTYINDRNQTPEITTSDTSIPLSDEQYEELKRHITSTMNNTEIISDPDFSLDRLAHIVDSNRTYVSVTINNTYHKNFKSLLNEYRIREACKRLSDKEHYGHITIQAIYEGVGYKNAASFIRAFKKEMGMTPSVYQKLEEDSLADRHEQEEDIATRC